MEQNELQDRVRDIFERQGFEVDIEDNTFVARDEDTEISGTLFSSQRFTSKEAIKKSEGKVFVDSGLSEVAGSVEDVSVLEEGDDTDVDMPSFEVIGDIAVINQLEMPEEDAVDAILSHHDIKTILLKTEPLQGEFRVGEYRKLYGTETETIHKENGCRFKVDVTEAYFSERLATERQRVVEKIRDGEEVLVIGAGVGPYPIEIARNANPSGVVAVEKNPEAVSMMRENVELNRAGSTVEVLEGDGIEYTDICSGFDKVISAIPHTDRILLPACLDAVAATGTILLYGFAAQPRSQSFENATLVRQEKCGDRGPSSTRCRFELSPDVAEQGH